MFTKKELKEIYSGHISDNLKEKVGKKLEMSKLDMKHTYFIYPNGKISKKYVSTKEAETVVEKKLGKWSSSNAHLWAKYVFVEVENGYEDSFSF